MKKFLKSIYQFFLTIYIFESGNKFDRINKKGTSIFFIKSLNKIKFNKNLKNKINNIKSKKIRNSLSQLIDEMKNV